MPRKKATKITALDPLVQPVEPDGLPPGREISFYRITRPSLEREAGEGTPIPPRLEDLVNAVHEFPQQKWFDYYGLKLRENTPLERIGYFSQALLYGALPDAGTLAFIAIAFDKYVRSDGTMTLDESFGLKSKPKAGNPVRQALRRNRITAYLFSMVDYRRHDPKVSIAKAAEAVRGDDESIPVETLEREYRRRRYDRLARDSGK